MQNNEFTLVNTLFGKVEKSFSDKRNINELMNYIRKYADKNSKILLSSDMSVRLIFTESDKKIIYTVTGITQQEVTAAIRQSTAIKSTWQIATNPFYMLSAIIMHYFAIHNMPAELDAMTVYMSYLLYVTSHKGSFKYLPNKQIMDYTINNLSNRFLIKQYGTIQAVIEHTVTNAIHDRYSKEIVSGSDEDLKNIVTALETRVSSAVKNVAREFYKNHASGNYMFHEDEDLSEENFHLSDNISFKISRIVSVVTTSIVSEGFDQYTCIKRAINLNPGSSEKKLTPMLRTIVTDDMDHIPEMISDIITLFIYKGTGNSINGIKTMKFVSESLQIYKSNSQDSVTLRIKERLLHWIDITAEKYGRNFISKGKTSLDTYRRAIYTCFVFKILECVK